MAITTYAELLTAIDNWTHRADLTSRAPEFIALFEAKVNRLLKTRDMETKDTSFSIASEYVTVPTGLAHVRQFYLNTSPKQVLELMPGDLQGTYFGSSTGRPRFYEIVGNEFRFGPAPDGTYTATIVYSKAITGLSGSNTTNWLLTSHPDLYLYGTLAEAAIFAKDADWAQPSIEAARQGIEELRSYDAQSKWGGNSMAVRLG